MTPVIQDQKASATSFNAQHKAGNPPLLELEESNESNGLTEKSRTLFRKAREHPGKALVCLMAIALSACGLSHYMYEAWTFENTDDAQVDGHMIPVSARIGGQIVGVKVEEGQHVNAGDILAVVDTRDYEVAIKRSQAALQDAKALSAGSQVNVPIISANARSALDSANAAVATAEAGVRGAEKNYEAAMANVERAEANHTKSKADATRYAQLVAKENVSRQQYEHAVAMARSDQASLSSAMAAVGAAEEALQQAKAKLRQALADRMAARTAPQQIVAAQSRADSAGAEVLKRQALLEQDQLNLSYTTIRSPVAGIIGKKTVEVGENVAPGQQLLTVIPLNDLWITANFKETQLAHMHPGQLARIKVDAFRRSWTARVTSIGGSTGALASLVPPENASGNYVKVVQRVPVRLDFKQTEGVEFNRDGLLRPGLSVEPQVRVR
jgi:membrane fusion protein (multidrug efflux system)